MSPVTYEQALENARAVKADVARAKIYLARGDVLKAVEAFCNALTAKIAVPMAGKEKNVIEPQMAEFCSDFSNNFQILEFLQSIDYTDKPFVAYRPGEEKKVLNKLAAYKLKVVAMEDAARQKVESERKAKLAELMTKGKELMESDQAAKGRSILKRAAEQFASEPGVLVEVGQILTAAGAPNDAIDILRQAMERFPKDPSPYKPYIDACAALGKNREIEEAYLAVVKLFGPHPQTYLNMSKFYLAWRKSDQAYEYAQRALGLDSSLKEAKDIVDRFS